jgi:predicted DNA-binding transcriptional regulator AlpA
MKNAKSKTAPPAPPTPELAAETAPVANTNAAAEYIDDRQLEARTSITRATWQIWRSKGTGPAYHKVGRRCLYQWAEVKAWLESKRVEPKAS